MALVGSAQHETAKISADVAKNEGDAPGSAAAIRTQLADLAQSDLIGSAERGVSLGATYGGANSQTIEVGRVALLPMGRDLYRLMRLDLLPAEEIDEALLRLGASIYEPLVGARRVEQLHAVGLVLN
jgi:hypothetical protein